MLVAIHKCRFTSAFFVFFNGVAKGLVQVRKWCSALFSRLASVHALAVALLHFLVVLIHHRLALLYTDSFLLVLVGETNFVVLSR